LRNPSTMASPPSNRLFMVGLPESFFLARIMSRLNPQGHCRVLIEPFQPFETFHRFASFKTFQANAGSKRSKSSSCSNRPAPLAQPKQEASKTFAEFSHRPRDQHINGRCSRQLPEGQALQSNTPLTEQRSPCLLAIVLFLKTDLFTGSDRFNPSQHELTILQIP
jgi:hypothetical protein